MSKFADFGAILQPILISPWSIWAIVTLATAGVILRPFSWPEFVWALSGAALLVGLGLLPLSDAIDGVIKGNDVYLFLTGMMLLAELAREEGLFDWVAARAVSLAKGSAARLYTLVFLVGTFVTIFLSNDATAVVLTPAVAAATAKAKAKEPLPYLLICAFIANAASFVLPISNPANLVIYGNHMPPLLEWIPRYALPSFASICATYVLLRWTQRRHLTQEIPAKIEAPKLPAGGKTAAFGLIATALILLISSGLGIQLGLPTFFAGFTTTILVLMIAKRNPLSVVKDMSWGVLPLVAGLFVMVQALQKTGITDRLAELLQHLVQASAILAAWVSGATLAFAGNLVNNLPAGLVAGRVIEVVQVPEHVRVASLIGVDLGPNLSVTGSLATLLWLTSIRRDGLNIGFWAFLKLGFLIMPPALLLAITGAFVPP